MCKGDDSTLVEDHLVIIDTELVRKCLRISNKIGALVFSFKQMVGVPV